MKKFRFIAVILALILVVGMTTGLIVRKQTGGQTVMLHSAQNSAQTSPVTTSEEDPPAPVEQVVKILLLVEHDNSYHVTVTENGVDLEPIDSIYYPLYYSGNEESKGHDPYYITLVDRYVVDPSCTSLDFVNSAKPSDTPEQICTVSYIFWSETTGGFLDGGRFVYDNDPSFDLSASFTFVFVDFENSSDIGN